MIQSIKQKIIVIVGPTASGKSEWGVRLAKKINGEIISADSRQVYRGLNIGSGKITKKEMRGIPHYCLDIASPRRVFTADNFKKFGERALKNILKREKTPIVLGGTGFYIDVLLNRVSTANVPPNQKLRKHLEKKSLAELFRILQKLDWERAKTIDRHNPRRLVRAIEILYSRKDIPLENLCAARLARAKQFFSRKICVVNKGNIFSRQALWIGIKRSPEDLKKRIHQRLTRRLPGIIREVKKLHANGLSWKRLFDLGLEYRYGSLYLQKVLAREEMKKKLETEIWHYARRQMTWWRRNKEINWVSNINEAQQFLNK